ncbi:hypothetical protein AMJ40_00575 [candidate division TA06 bacterium DG_26]|uniref:Haloacid dehalogenase n=1 Tax=candidate division TA06 bacterium DG_26 TaxID=1703771 RepID=A0A0S7WM53_UNCT6|nr:MAG: hypothetical protein AMJ40_00575 [candidate division TA06 bacterium DG_26]
MERLVLFDIDGTLVESSRVHVRAFSEAFMQVYRVSASIDMIEHHGMTDPAIIVEVLRRVGVDEETIQTKLEECMNAMIVSFNRLIEADRVCVLQGVEQLLEKLQTRHTLLGLVTGNLEPIARIKLEHAGLLHRFKLGAFGSDASDRAELVRLAVRRAEDRFGFHHGGRVFLIGDTPRDAEAGEKAGVTTIGVATGIYTQEHLQNAGADFVFMNLEDTDAFVNIIFARE